LAGCCFTGINLILNADPHSFARVHFLEYGPSVCAIGLVTDDPVRAMNRATASQAVRFGARLGPDEVPILAVTAPDGSLIDFIEEAFGANGLFEIGFDLGPDDFGTSADAGLLTIDHIALGLPTDALDTWVLFCRAVLGMPPADSLELSDPYDLIRSAGMANPDRSVRFVLNICLSQRTHTARTIDTLGGRSVHHIGIACSNIIETVSHLRAVGVEFVPISPQLL
jgi:4-hydroxyphenylpyruvate dioxygenase